MENKVVFNRPKHTYTTEDELRYFCRGIRRIMLPKRDEFGNVIGGIYITLDETDLDNIIMAMKASNEPFSLQTFKKIQADYIIEKSCNTNVNSIEPQKHYTKTLTRVGA